eukprot:6734266-Pyramimonas_sp.AAC.1
MPPLVSEKLGPHTAAMRDPSHERDVHCRDDRGASILAARLTIGDHLQVRVREVDGKRGPMQSCGQNPHLVRRAILEIDRDSDCLADLIEHMFPRALWDRLGAAACIAVA